MREIEDLKNREKKHLAEIHLLKSKLKGSNKEENETPKDVKVKKEDTGFYEYKGILVKTV